MADIVFGCDICQQVCPLNDSPVMAGQNVSPPRPISQRSVRDLAAMTREQYDAWVPGTALARAQFDGLRRNAAYALGAAADVSSRDVLEQLSADANPHVAEAAAWALARLAPVRTVRSSGVEGG